MTVHLRKTAEGYVLPVLVAPGAGRDAIRGEHDGRMKVALVAAPEKGKANKALCKLLARKLGIRQGEVRILSGHTSRKKEVLVERVPPGTLDGILG